MQDLAFTDNPGAQRFELRRGGQLAGQADYRLEGATLVLTHTEVQPAFEGQGIGSRLAQAVLGEARRRGLKVVAQCPFMAGYIRKHAQYQDLLATD